MDHLVLEKLYWLKVIYDINEMKITLYLLNKYFFIYSCGYRMQFTFFEC